MPVVELRVDRNLVCPNFNGYKLSFDPVAVLREDLHVTPSRLDPSWNDYSRLHGEVFARHNLLCADPWMRHNTYFINSRHQVMQCVYDAHIGHSLGLRVVYTMENRDHGDGHAQMTGDYNYSLCFISERFCVICDGISTYHLLDTGDRSRPSAEPWKLVIRTPVDKEGGLRGYIMYDARLDVVQERKQISLVAGHVSRRDANGARPWVTYMDLVWGHWVFNVFTNEWEYTIRERLETTGSLQYCAFEPRAESLVLGSNGKIETRKQREAADAAAAAAAAAGPIIPSPEGAQNGHDAADDDGKTYTWDQTDSEVIIRFPLPENATRDDITIRNTSTSVEVIYLEQVLLRDELFLPVRTESALWNVEGRALHLTLTKQMELQRWPHLLKQDDAEAPDDMAGASSENLLRAGPSSTAGLPIPNLEDPIEECDLGNLDDDNRIVRFNLPKNEITHTIFLGSHPVLFVSNLRPGFPAAFATRQGVDASVWLQVYQPSRPDEWGVRHVGQMHAFAYVQASKENRTFTACCPEFEYTVICESRRNVLIYYNRYDSAEGLRKRNGPQIAIGKQKLINIDVEHGDILGVTTANRVVTILTEGALLHLQL
ncbi:hypothetical protein KR054_010437 [Drosophila jambulina]|nr:hypothetical protein KR054_010437 [Drosophila jambulina]